MFQKYKNKINKKHNKKLKTKENEKLLKEIQFVETDF